LNLFFRYVRAQRVLGENVRESRKFIGDEQEHKVQGKEGRRVLIQKLEEVLPRVGMLYREEKEFTPMLCEPIMIPLKSITLQKIEEMEKKAIKILQA